MNRFPTRRTIWAWLLFGGALGCTTMATMTNVRDQPCRQNFSSALSEMLVEEGEETDRVQRLVENPDSVGSVFDYGPRPFSVSSRSGTDYSFFVGKRRGVLITPLWKAEGLYPLYEQSDLHPHQGTLRLPVPGIARARGF